MEQGELPLRHALSFTVQLLCSPDDKGKAGNPQHQEAPSVPAPHRPRDQQAKVGQHKSGASHMQKPQGNHVVMGLPSALCNINAQTASSALMCWAPDAWPHRV